MSFNASYRGPDASKDFHQISGSTKNEPARRAGLAFNPSANKDAARIKAFGTALLTSIEAARIGTHNPRGEENMVDGYQEQQRLFARASDKIEEGIMLAVKGIHAAEPDPRAG